MKKLFTTLCVICLSSVGAFAQVGWIGNHSTSTTTAPGGSSFNVTLKLEVWKDTVTNPAGQGAGITCNVHWSGGVVVGGSWPTPTTVPATYSGDNPNNDIYEATVTVTTNGYYEFTANCTSDSVLKWAGDFGTGNYGFTISGLPISLASFTGTATENAATLNWVTVSELNSDHFDVEHSANGSAWKKVGTVQAAGNSIDLRNYSYTVEGLQVGKHSFRLKSVDKNGDARYTASVQLNVEVPGQYVLYPAYPNPFNPATTITFAVASRQAVKAEVFNALGQKVRPLFSGTLEANVPHSAQFDASGLQSGMYIVRVTGANFKATQNVTLLK